MNARSSHRRCSKKKLFLKISQYYEENTCVGFSFFKNTYFDNKHLCSGASGRPLYFEANLFVVCIRPIRFDKGVFSCNLLHKCDVLRDLVPFVQF